MQVYANWVVPDTLHKVKQGLVYHAKMLCMHWLKADVELMDQLQYIQMMIKVHEMVLWSKLRHILAKSCDVHLAPKPV